MWFFKIKRKKTLNVSHSSQLPESKSTFTSNSSNKKDFFKKIGQYTFFFLYLCAKYEPIQTDLLPKQWILVLIYLLRPKLYLKTQCELYFYTKVGFTKNIKIWIWLRFLRYGFFAIFKYVKIPITVKMCQNILKTINKPKNH